MDNQPTFFRSFKMAYNLILGKEDPIESEEKEPSEDRVKLKAILAKHRCPISDPLLEELLLFLSEKTEEAFNDGYGCGSNSHGWS